MIRYRAPGNILCSLLFIDPHKKKKTLLIDIFLFLKKDLHLVKAQLRPQSDYVLHSHGYREDRKQHLCHELIHNHTGLHAETAVPGTLLHVGCWALKHTDSHTSQTHNQPPTP